jgi:2,4-dienoyl-CoA reductase-like NADH-dependent reductase (Old Yellow Enzyme family)
VTTLFASFELRQVRFRNRIFVSPMCQYSAVEGRATDWHLVHLGSRAAGGAGLVMAEATAVSPEGRISPDDLGLWTDAQVDALVPIARFLKGQGAVAAIQLAHAGRKAATAAPWNGGAPLDPASGGWTPVAPSAVRFDAVHPVPEALDAAGLARIEGAFAAAAERARRAGFEVVEIHMAHGYLLHEFLSPIANRRTDGYGGSLENRMRFPLRVAGAVREAWPAHLPLFARLSVTDWVDGGWDAAQSVELARRLRDVGVDLIDCSSGGMTPDAKIPYGPGFQVPLAERIRAEAGIPTGAVGFITEPEQAQAILAGGKADAVFLAREFLREPSWPLKAARALGAEAAWPRQYLRAKPA